MTAEAPEVFVVTSTGSGHLYPCLQLCHHISARLNYKPTLVLPSSLSASADIPANLSTVPISPNKPGSDPTHNPAARDLEAHLSRHGSACVVCAIVDFQMGWIKHVFWKFNIPLISLFTFGACAVAMEWGAWKCRVGELTPGESVAIPGLPEDMCISFSDLKRRSFGRMPAGSGGSGGGPPKPGDRPPWVPLIEGSIGLMFNTSVELELPFLSYIADQIGLPVWGVGPLLPELYWQPSDSLISDRQIRQSNHHSNYSEDEVRQWLDCKPERSVLYVAFGSQVGPTLEEYPILAGALEDSTRSFIWVILREAGLSGGPDGENVGYYPHGMDERIGARGLIIRGWAPQLMILSHSSTGGFLSHCGWNSTMEAIGRGVPFLTWPIRGDQFYNAKLVVSHLKVGHIFGATKEEMMLGIEKLIGDAELHKQAMEFRGKFESGFPSSSKIALDDFEKFTKQKKANALVEIEDN